MPEKLSGSAAFLDAADTLATWQMTPSFAATAPDPARPWIAWIQGWNDDIDARIDAAMRNIAIGAANVENGTADPSIDHPKPDSAWQHEAGLDWFVTLG